MMVPQHVRPSVRHTPPLTIYRELPSNDIGRRHLPAPDNARPPGVDEAGWVPPAVASPVEATDRRRETDRPGPAGSALNGPASGAIHH